MVSQINDFKRIFKSAYDNRYTWPEMFNGYKGSCIYESKNNLHKGSFNIAKDFKPTICDIKNKEIIKSISSQLFEVTIHRVKRDFNDIHSQNDFELVTESKDGLEVIVRGRNEGDKYRIKNNKINMVYRKIHGFIIEIFVEDFMDTSKGCLSRKYTSQQINPNTLSVMSNKLEYLDEFIKINDEIYLLKSRSIKHLNEIQKFIFDDLVLL